MDIGAGLSARVLHLIRQAQLVDELLSGSQRVGARVAEHVVTFVRNGADPLKLLVRTAC